MFPFDAVNVRKDFFGNVSSSTLFSLPSSTNATVLYESFNSNANDVNANLLIFCGSTDLLRVNSFSLVPALERFKFAKCSSDIAVTTSGLTAGKITTVSLIYTPRNLQLATTVEPTLVVATSTPDNTNSFYTVTLLIVIAGILMLDLFRRIFTKS